MTVRMPGGIDHQEAFIAKEVDRPAVRPLQGAAVKELFNRKILSERPDLTVLVHLTAAPEILVLRQNNAFCPGHMPKPRRVIRIQVTQDHKVQILWPDPAGSKLLMDGFTCGKHRPQQGGHVPRKESENRFLIVNAGGTDLTAPAGIHKDQARGMFDQVDRDRQRDPITVRRQQIPGELPDAGILIISDRRGDPDRPAVQNMQPDRFFRQAFCSPLQYGKQPPAS